MIFKDQHLKGTTMTKTVVVKSRPFAGIDRNPSLLGFGLMRLPVKQERPDEIDTLLAEKMVDLAIERGVTYFDTAYPYHDGKSELFIGQALKKYPRDAVFLASKMPGWHVHSAADASRIFEEQLHRCQVDYFDYYLLHALNRTNVKAYHIPGVLDYLLHLRQIGKIRHLGFSFHDSPEVLGEIMSLTNWEFVQIQLNYLDWTFQKAKEQYEIIEKAQIPCIVMEPVRGGLLAALSPESRAIFLAHDSKRSLASWAIRYAASKSNVMVVLSGMSSLDQTEDNLETLTNFQPITAKEQNVIDQALTIFMKRRLIPCTRCGYCLPCPFNVDIPNNIRLYNEYQLDQSEEEFQYWVGRMAPEERSSLCQACRLCVTRCPQSIAIPDELKKINALIEQLANKTEPTDMVKTD